uniref:Uncharacterized protein n=1 Tax=Strigamia maritima TaxID=126957 RepID=T1JKU0_STRMM
MAIPSPYNFHQSKYQVYKKMLADQREYGRLMDTCNGAERAHSIYRPNDLAALRSKESYTN